MKSSPPERKRMLKILVWLGVERSTRKKGSGDPELHVLVTGLGSRAASEASLIHIVRQLLKQGKKFSLSDDDSDDHGALPEGHGPSQRESHVAALDSWPHLWPCVDLNIT